LAKFLQTNYAFAKNSGSFFQIVFIFVIWILDLICHLDFVIWVFASD